MTNYNFQNKTFNDAHVSLFSRLSLVVVLVLFMVGCEGNQPTNSGLELNSDEVIQSMGSVINKKFDGVDSDLIKLVKQGTARYQSTTQAILAGYAEDDHCVAVPGLGGMGYHWVNEDLVDPVFDPAQPEALLYEADKNGNLKLVGVEYIVINVGQNHPHFGDHPFDIEGVPPLMAAGVPHWSLHVWLYKDNPNGMFTPFNPNVVCY